MITLSAWSMLSRNRAYLAVLVGRDISPLELSLPSTCATSCWFKHTWIHAESDIEWKPVTSRAVEDERVDDHVWAVPVVSRVADPL
jgi:hypothetical protein